MKSLRVWFGAVLLALGLLLVLDMVGVVRAGAVISRWWALALVGLGVLALIRERRFAPGPLVVILVGLTLLSGAFAGTVMGPVAWPAIAVLIGLWLLLGYRRGRGPVDRSSDRQDVFAVIGASHAINRSTTFRHADVVAVCGGATLDLTAATPAPSAQVDALALLGGVEVIVPPGWRVEMTGLPIFGGYQDKTAARLGAAEDAPVLRVMATAIFGGVEVKNPNPASPGAAPPPGVSAAPTDLRADLR